MDEGEGAGEGRLRALREFWQRHAEAEQPLRAWFRRARKANWNTPAGIWQAYRTASFLSNSRAVLNIKRNQYRLVVAVNYGYGIMYVRFVGTHSDYDRIDAATT